MAERKREIARLAAAIVLTTWAAVAAQAPAPQLPLEPLRETGQSVIGAFEGWYQNPDGTFSLLVGYMNRNTKEVLEIPVGPNNRIEPGGPDVGQPTHFLPRRQWGVFTVKVPKDFGDKRLTWTIVANGQTTTIPLNLNPLWIVEPFKDAGGGNTPPRVRFTAGGTPLQGPPNDIAHTLTTSVSKPLELTVWVTDDGAQPPEARPRPGPPATVSWSTFRGPGPVTIEKATPVSMDDGKSTAVARFSRAGEYVLRTQINDASGDGGGGNQCCWTNALVKVTVTP